MTDPALAEFWRLAWRQLGGRAHRLVTLASVGCDGAPQLRQVMLRAVDPDAQTLTAYTDLTSVKIAELAANAQGAILHWSPQIELQIRVNGPIMVRSGDALRPLWDRLPEAARGSYGVTPPPGTEIAGPESYNRTPDFAQFAELTLTAEALDVVDLQPQVHRRASFTRQRDWRGAWRAP